MFQLLYDAAHNVLLTQLSGVYSEEDIVLRDKQAARFVARNGLARGLMDYTRVTKVDIPMDLIIRRAQAPPILPGQTRVVVADNEPAYSLNRVIVAHQYFSRKVEPLVVDSLQDAYYALGSSHFAFQPLEEDAQARRERAVLGALATIDAGGRKRAAHYRLQSAAARQRMAEAEAVSPMAERRRFSFIMVSDLLNTGLRSAQLADRELGIQCPRCRCETTLASCPLLGRQQTTYLCPACRARLVDIVPLKGGVSAEASGYALAGFDVQTRTDIHCHGVVLPKSRSG